MVRFGGQRLTACLLHNELASYSQWHRLSISEPQRKRVRIGRWSLGIDAKRNDLPLARVKSV